MDAIHPPRARLRGHAVLLFLAGLGEHLGFAIWGEVPTLSLVIGSVIVVASGLFLLWRETAARQLVAESSRE